MNEYNLSLTENHDNFHFSEISYELLPPIDHEIDIGGTKVVGSIPEPSAIMSLFMIGSLLLFRKR